MIKLGFMCLVIGLMAEAILWTEKTERLIAPHVTGQGNLAVQIFLPSRCTFTAEHAVETATVSLFTKTSKDLATVVENERTLSFGVPDSGTLIVKAVDGQGTIDCANSVEDAFFEKMQIAVTAGLSAAALFFLLAFAKWAVSRRRV